jgi:L-rhamnose-H+ transport protein
MTPDLVTGLAGVLIGGLFNGSFVAPMKALRKWQWENSWLVYSLSGLVVIPWLAALLTVPRLGEVYASASASSLLSVLGYGFGWGIGSVLFGIGVSRIGLAVGYGIILGLIAPIGTFYPLLMLYPERLWTSQGRALMTGTAIVLVGIFLCGRAGRIREQATLQSGASQRSGFGVALLICILAGIFSPMLNFTFVFGKPLQDQALAFGAAQSMASNAIWPLALGAGAIVNAGYCVWLLSRHGSWARFSGSGAGHWMGGTAMGLLCFLSFLVYGLGATALGSLGGIVGWPLFMSMALITSNLLGAFTGEWKGAPRRAWLYSVAGMALLIVAITVIARGGGA